MYASARPRGTTGASPAGGRPSGPLADMLNGGENARWVAEMGARLNGGPGVVQRQMRVAGDLEDHPAIVELRHTALYAQLDASPRVIYIRRARAGVNTAVLPVKTTNKTEVERAMGGEPYAGIDYIISVTDAELGGLDVAADRSYSGLPAEAEAADDLPALEDIDFSLPPELAVQMPLPQPELEPEPEPFRPRGIFASGPEPRWDRLPDLVEGPSHVDELQEQFGDEMVPIFSLGGLGRKAQAAEPLPRLPRRRRPRGISAFTVILHELGHVRQELRTPQAYLGQPSDDLRETPKPAVPANVVQRITDARQAGELTNAVWPELFGFANSASSWLHEMEDDKADAPAAEALAREISHLASVWLEYDVVTNVEHPTAEARGERIRHTHGIEEAVDPQGFEGLKQWSGSRRPQDRGQLQQQMIAVAQQLTAALPVKLQQFLELYNPM